MALQVKAKYFVSQQWRLVGLTVEKTFHIFKGGSKTVVQTYAKSMRKRPYLTNSFNASVLGLVGDVICQKVVEKRQEMDWMRTARFVFFCTYYQVSIS